jgi:hypothetical protein
MLRGKNCLSARGAQIGGVGAICDRPSACALHADRRANTVRPYDGKATPGEKATPGASYGFLTFHLSHFTFHLSRFTK